MRAFRNTLTALLLPLVVSFTPFDGLAAEPVVSEASDGGAATVRGEDCYVCEGIWDMELQQWVPGSIRCDEANPEEQGKVNCMADQQGTECQIDQYDDCEGSFQEDVLLVQLPGVSGVGPSATEWTFRTGCSASPMTTTSVQVVNVD